MKDQTAIIIGATGLVGFKIVQQLLENRNFSTVKVFTRRSLEIDHFKLEERLVDFDQLDHWKNELTGDILFSAMGTTIRKAGSKAAQYKIDYTYQYETAQAAANNGVKTFCLVSSAGANPKSSVFYSKMKGELDEAVKKIGFKHTFIFRPSILAGNRNESRLGEKIGLILARIFTNIPGLTKYRPIQGATVAKAIIHVSETTEIRSSFEIYTLSEIFEILKAR
jgi:uncharacterized protein YbjT (DUF2867 family)